LKGFLYGKADVERLIGGLINWVMAQDIYLRFFKVSYSIKPLYVVVASLTAKPAIPCQ
jgi:hypothetical protein